MSMWQEFEEIFKPDLRERIAAGTIGAEQVTPGSLTGSQMSSRISIFDPRVTQVPTTQGFNSTLRGYDQSTTIEYPGNITLNFKGSAVSIIGDQYQNGGQSTVYVDGVLTPGRLSLTTTTKSAVGVADSTIQVSSVTGYPTSGQIEIDGEIISYTGVTTSLPNSFNGCTRGQNGTTAATHNLSSTVYAFGSTIDQYAPYGRGDVPLWTVRNLTAGPHTLQIVKNATDNPSASQPTTLGISSFIVSGMIGSSNINSYIDYYLFTVTFGANGMATSAFSPPVNTSEAAFLAPVGAAAYNGSTYIPCFYSFHPTSGDYWFYCPTSPSTTLTVVLSTLMLGPTI